MAQALHGVFLLKEVPGEAAVRLWRRSVRVVAQAAARIFAAASAHAYCFAECPALEAVNRDSPSGAVLRCSGRSPGCACDNHVQ